MTSGDVNWEKGTDQKNGELGRRKRRGVEEEELQQKEREGGKEWGGLEKQLFYL